VDRKKDDLIANNRQAIVAFTPPMVDARAAAGGATHASPPEGGREHAVLAGGPAAGRAAPRLPAARPQRSLHPAVPAAAADH
jgi:hypothetical protein